MNGSNVIDISRRYVRFYAEHIECYYCGHLSRGRVYDSMQSVVCGYCGALWRLFGYGSRGRWDG